MSSSRVSRQRGPGPGPSPDETRGAAARERVDLGNAVEKAHAVFRMRTGLMIQALCRDLGLPCFDLVEFVREELRLTEEERDEVFLAAVEEQASPVPLYRFPFPRGAGEGLAAGAPADAYVPRTRGGLRDAAVAAAAAPATGAADAGDTDDADDDAYDADTPDAPRPSLAPPPAAPYAPASARRHSLPVWQGSPPFPSRGPEPAAVSPDLARGVQASGGAASAANPLRAAAAAYASGGGALGGGVLNARNRALSDPASPVRAHVAETSPAAAHAHRRPAYDAPSARGGRPDPEPRAEQWMPSSPDLDPEQALVAHPPAFALAPVTDSSPSATPSPSASASLSPPSSEAALAPTSAPASAAAPASWAPPAHAHAHASRGNGSAHEPGQGVAAAPGQGVAAAPSPSASVPASVPAPAPVSVARAIRVPSSAVSAIIGRGGTNIARIRARTRATIRIFEESGEPEATVVVTGAPTEVDLAEVLIKELKEVRDGGEAGGGAGGRRQPAGAGAGAGAASGGAGGFAAPAAPTYLRVVKVPTTMVSMLIGHGGSSVARMRSATNTSIAVSDDRSGAFTSVALTGSPRDVAACEKLILRRIANRREEEAAGVVGAGAAGAGAVGAGPGGRGGRSGAAAGTRTGGAQRSGTGRVAHSRGKGAGEAAAGGRGSRAARAAYPAGDASIRAGEDAAAGRSSASLPTSEEEKDESGAVAQEDTLKRLDLDAAPVSEVPGRAATAEEVEEVS